MCESTEHVNTKIKPSKCYKIKSAISLPSIGKLSEEN